MPKKNEKVGFETQISNTIIGLYKIDYVNRSPDQVNYIPGRKPYQINKNFHNFLKISFHDNNKRIISGTFEFVAIDEFNSDTIYITDGRFDGKYKEDGLRQGRNIKFI